MITAKQCKENLKPMEVLLTGEALLGLSIQFNFLKELFFKKKFQFFSQFFCVALSHRCLTEHIRQRAAGSLAWHRPV